MKSLSQQIAKITRLQETKACKLKYIPIKNLNEEKLSKQNIKEILLSKNYQERMEVTLKYGLIKKAELKKEELALIILRDVTKTPTTVEFCYGGVERRN
jgi:hypothetical protein